MKTIKTEYPNPVLEDGGDDYIKSCSFHTVFTKDSITVDEKNIIIEISYELKCEGLRKLIFTRDAVVVVLVKSSITSYSRMEIFPQNTTEMTIKIPKFGVATKIDIVGYIIAAHNIDEFTCPGEFNEMFFEGVIFSIQEGNILATEPVRYIYLDDSELEKPVSSIFTICRLPEDVESQNIVPDFEEDKIKIYLSKELFDFYYEFKDANDGALRKYATAIVVYPVLVEALKYVTVKNGEDNEYSDKQWFRTIEHKIDTQEIDIEAPLTTIANKLLGNISADAFTCLKDAFDNDINSGDVQTFGGND